MTNRARFHRLPSKQKWPPDDPGAIFINRKFFSLARSLRQLADFIFQMQLFQLQLSQEQVVRSR